MAPLASLPEAPVESPNALLPDIPATRADMILAYILSAFFVIFCVLVPCLCTRRYRAVLAAVDEDPEAGDLGWGGRRRRRQPRDRRARGIDFVPDLTSAAEPPLPIYARHPTQDEVHLAGTPPKVAPPIYQSRVYDKNGSSLDRVT